MSTPLKLRVLQTIFLSLETLFAGSFVCVLILADDWYANGLRAGGVLSVVLVTSALPLAVVSFLLRRVHRALAIIGGCSILAVVVYVLITPRLWIPLA